MNRIVVTLKGELDEEYPVIFQRIEGEHWERISRTGRSGLYTSDVLYEIAKAITA